MLQLCELVGLLEYGNRFAISLDFETVMSLDLNGISM